MFLSVGYAPFGSMTSRETFVDVPDQTIAAPGPGQYDLKLRNANHIVGGQSLSNTVRVEFFFYYIHVNTYLFVWDH